MLYLDDESESCRSGTILKLLEILWSSFSQGSENCQNLRYESLIIADLKYIEISSLAVLNINTDYKKLILSDIE